MMFGKQIYEGVRRSLLSAGALFITFFVAIIATAMSIMMRSEYDPIMGVMK